jgi:heptosyltransferase-3
MHTLLIYRLGSLGDTVLCLPCFHRIAERFPNSRRIVITNKPVSSSAPGLLDVLTGSDLVHGTIDYPLGSRSPLELGRLWLKLRTLKAEALVYLTAARGRSVALRDVRFFRSCGISEIIGAPLTDDLQINMTDAISGEEEQECARLVRTLAELGPIDLDNRAYWDLRLTNSEMRVADNILEPFGGAQFVAVNMGGKSAGNDWGEANWRTLITALHNTFKDFRIVFVGAKNDSDRANDIAATAPGRSLDLCGRLTPRETAAVLSRSTLFIGHDSGPLHLAAACNVPCIGIYSNRHKPRKWHPYGAWHSIFHPTGPISSVPVDRVRDAVVSALSKGSSSWSQGSVAR